MNSDTLITFLGLSAAILGAVTYFPQLFRILKTKHTKDISLATYLLLDLVTFMWFVYALFRNDIPLMVNGGLVLICIVTITILKLRHG